ncbi:beta-ketoacyl synthase N-terminal-like domain-containing protein [Chitinispirillales bacterium ANBcel5]|uniref:beta-ketoacyl synthase N-terminal-like domain-containing protein n=1 Tax=Cellulosispirillum alkaliphilum TaxID=3039283 RepID=UPI002A50068F|nr:beta-ketoacyl synthase N-terminal-like domain-containing protein [Chitinispirillales bacterium ANBcel5]
MSSKKVYISNSGAMCSLGLDSNTVYQNLSSPGPLSYCKEWDFHQLDSTIPCRKVEGYDPKAVLGKKGLRTKDFSTKLLLGTIELNFNEIMSEEDEQKRPGLCIGTAFGSLQSIGDFLSESIVSGVSNVNPQIFANTVINSPTGNANIRYLSRNLSTTVSTGFNAGLDALIYSKDYISRNYLPRLIAGGLEEISYYTIIGLLRSQVLATSGNSIPFSPSSEGIIPGEGCALFLVENEDEAFSNEKKPLVEIAGTASGFDPELLSGQSDGNTDVRIIQKALEDASVSAQQIDFIASSANGNKLTDKIESSAIHSVFGDKIPVTAYKHAFGECYGASGALITACAVSDMKNDTVSGTAIQFDPSDSNIMLLTEKIQKKSTYAIVTSFSCEGNVSAVVLKNV